VDRILSTSHPSNGTSQVFEQHEHGERDLAPPPAPRGAPSAAGAEQRPAVLEVPTATMLRTLKNRISSGWRAGCRRSPGRALTSAPWLLPHLWKGRVVYAGGRSSSELFRRTTPGRASDSTSHHFHWTVRDVVFVKCANRPCRLR